MMFREKNDRAILKTISEILQHDNKNAAAQFKVNSEYLKNTTYAGLQINESKEQLDEISKKTMMSYVSKAADQVYGHGQKPLQDPRKRANRHAGAEIVAKRLTQEDLDIVADIINQLDEEQLDELSKKTLGSYINKAAKLTKEDFDLNEDTKKVRVGSNHIHIKSVGNGKYKVHAVGKNFSDGIQVGEHLTDTDLDDFTEMGGKIKHISESRSLRDILEQARRYSGEE